jgi:hypothetical protein
LPESTSCAEVTVVFSSRTRPSAEQDCAREIAGAEQQIDSVKPGTRRVTFERAKRLGAEFLIEWACIGESSWPLTAGGEDLRELLRWHYLQLLEGAVAWALVLPPAAKLRGVSEAVALHVVVRDLDDELRP